jgi:hypothetical protein
VRLVVLDVDAAKSGSEGKLNVKRPVWPFQSGVIGGLAEAEMHERSKSPP